GEGGVGCGSARARRVVEVLASLWRRLTLEEDRVRALFTSAGQNLCIRRATSESCGVSFEESYGLGWRKTISGVASLLYISSFFVRTEKSQVYEYQYGSIAFCSSTKNTGVSKKKGKGCVANYTSHSVVEVKK
ncbi:hypothetical protein Tco_1416348, partial [Tanacetum coccineum]